MRKAIALKTLLRSPLKTLLTFFLIAAASFALFSRVTDYAVTTKETKNAESLYHAVAYLDNEVPDIPIETKAVQSADATVMTGYGYVYEMEDKPWPTKEELKEFASLPGVTVADMRYRTAGRVEDYKRLDDNGGRGETIVFEGTYGGYVDDSDPSVLEDHVRLKFDDVRLIACEDGLDIGTSFFTEDIPLGDMYYARSTYTRTFFDSLKKGSRCLVLAHHSGLGGANSGIYLWDRENEEMLRILDGQPDNYLETESFARQKQWVDEINHNLYTYDIVYTSDMRAIPAFNEQSRFIAEGRSLTADDTDACVVSKEFLKTHGLSIGDRINIRLGDRPGSSMVEVDEGVPGFADSAEPVIVGTYAAAKGEVHYPVNTIYVPASLLPVKVPEDDTSVSGELSVFVEEADDIEAFYEAARQFAEKVDLTLEYSDRGWLDVKDSLETGAFTSFLTTVLYVAGAALALFLAVYLYIGRNKKTYAIMRMLGVTVKTAENSVVLPFVVLTVLAVPVGGVVGLYYAQSTAAKALTRMADSAPAGYIPDAALPVHVIILCLLMELLFVFLTVYFFLRKMKQTPPLELLQEGAARTGAHAKVKPAIAENVPVSVRLDTAKLSDVNEWIPRGNYRSVRHMAAYVWRHMRRSIGKTAVSLSLAVVLAAGIGTFVLVRITYQDAFEELGVKGKATEFIFSSVADLSKSPLVKDFYCYDSFGVRIEGTEQDIIMTVTNDLVHKMGDGCTVEYGEGYDISAFDGTAQVCLIGKEIAGKLNISPGDEIHILSDLLYSALKDTGGEEAVAKGYKTYKVIGVAESGDTEINNGIFAGIKSDLQRLFSMDFPVEYCEFKLSDNEKVDELDAILMEKKDRSFLYAPDASYHLDSGGLINIRRIRGLLESLFPIAVAAAVLIGLSGPLLIILQSAQEAAFLRVLGVTKKRARCMLILEQILLSIVGIALVVCIFALLESGLFAKSVQTLVFCWTLYLLGCICGASASAIQVTRSKVLELLQVKE